MKSQWFQLTSNFSLTESVSDMMEVTLFNITFTCIICIAFNLLAVELSESFSLELMVASSDIAVVIGITAVYYFHSEWITSDLLEIGDNFYNSTWYLLPVHQQRLLVLPIQRADREFRLKALGLFECSKAVFLSVNGCFFYFFQIVAIFYLNSCASRIRR